MEKTDCNLPYFPCYIADWLIDTQDLTDEQDGAYFRVVRYQWKHGSIPNDMKIMRRISDSIDDTWPVINKFFKIDENDNLINGRTDRERQKIVSKIKAGSKGGSKTPSKGGSETPSKTDITQNSELRTHNTEQRTEKKRKRFTPPLFVDVVKRMTDTSLKNHLDQSRAEREADAFINFYSSNGWKVGKNKMVSWPSAVSTWLGRIEREEIKDVGYIPQVED